jgi:phosphodiesterase/alkaline phosphatase D-like protein
MKIDRRKFLQSSLVAGAALATAQSTSMATSGKKEFSGMTEDFP